MLPCLDILSINLLLVCVFIYFLKKCWKLKLQYATKPGEDLATLTLWI